MTKSLGTIAGLGLLLAIIFFVLAAMVSPFSFRGIGRAGAAPSKPETRQFTWDGGDRLQIDLPAKVTLMPDGPPGVIVRGDQDLVQQVSLHNGKLSSDGDDDCYIPFFCGDHRHTVTVELHGIPLKEVRVDGVAEVDMGHLDQDRLTLRLSGAGKVEGEGKLDELDISISGAGDASFGGLAVGRARVTLSGVGNAEISPSQEADITISGVGNVRLDTRPASLIQHVSGVGNITGPGSEKNRNDDNDRPSSRTEALPIPLSHGDDDLRRQIRLQTDDLHRHLHLQAERLRRQLSEQAKEASKQARAQARLQVDEALRNQGLR